MHGLPKDFDPSIFVGRELQEICISENTLSLSFYPHGLLVVIDSALSHRGSASSIAVVTKIPGFRSELMKVLGHSIVRAAGDAKGTLTLEFDDGQVLECLDTSSQFESYHIHH